MATLSRTRRLWTVHLHWNWVFGSGYWPRPDTIIFRYWNIGPFEIRRYARLTYHGEET